jgi:hypothetical protein
VRAPLGLIFDPKLGEGVCIIALLNAEPLGPSFDEENAPEYVDFLGISRTIARPERFDNYQHDT